MKQKLISVSLALALGLSLAAAHSIHSNAKEQQKTPGYGSFLTSYLIFFCSSFFQSFCNLRIDFIKVTEE